MLLSEHAHTVGPGEGRTVNLGNVQMRILAAGKFSERECPVGCRLTAGKDPHPDVAEIDIPPFARAYRVRVF